MQPDTQRCGRCRATKPITGFYTQGVGRIAGWCKACRCEDERKRRARDLQGNRERHAVDMDFRAKRVLAAIAKRSRREGVDFNLDVAWLKRRLDSGVCELTGLAFDMRVTKRGPSPFTPSVDRIAAGSGYTKTNCRVVLHVVNSALGDWGLDTLLPIAEALVRRQSKTEVAA